MIHVTHLAMGVRQNQQDEQFDAVGVTQQTCDLFISTETCNGAEGSILWEGRVGDGAQTRLSMPGDIERYPIRGEQASSSVHSPNIRDMLAGDKTEQGCQFSRKVVEC